MPLINKATGSFISFDGTEIYYEVRGKGPPIVMVYGIGCLINHWHFQYEEFSKDYQTIVFDFRGHHKSDSPKDLKNMSTEAIAKDLVLLCDHLKIESTAFLGHSFGGQVLIKAYEMRPELFKNIVLINGFASNPVADMFGNGLPEKIFYGIKSGHKALPDTVSTLWKSFVNSPISAPITALAGGFNIKLTQLKDIEIYLQGISSIPLDSFITLFESMMKFDGRPLLKKIDAPVLLVSGGKDSITPLKYQMDLKRRIKNCELMEVPYGSHCSQLDFPEYVNMRIEKFFRTHQYS